MNKFVRICMLALVGGAVAAPLAQAQLQISGNTYGVFANPLLPYTTVSNGPVTSKFSSGVAYRPYAPWHDTPTSITFKGSSFTDVPENTLFQVGSFTFKNGITKLHTTASSALMDLYINVSTLGISHYKLATFNFGIDNTDNNGVQNIPDLFNISWPALNNVNMGGDYLITFTLFASDPSFFSNLGKQIGENHSAGLVLDMKFTPVPEPSTYALAGAAVLAGVILLRRKARPATVAAA
jgi:hypothetical protein